MKKYVILFLISIFLCAYTSLGELLRLPILIHHYKEHIVWDNNSSLLDFLTKHYALKIDHPDDQHHDHEKLPFKSMDYIHLGLVIHPEVIVTWVPALVFTQEIQANNIPQYSPHAFIGNIWQPPKTS